MDWIIGFGLGIGAVLLILWLTSKISYKEPVEAPQLDPRVDKLAEQLDTWLSELRGKYRCSAGMHYWKKGCRVNIYTTGHAYQLLASYDPPGGYLGCKSVERDWIHYTDLADGKFCEETWQRIAQGIEKTEAM